MPNIGLGMVEAVVASRAISGNGQYMPDSSTVLTKSGGATSDTWGAAMLAQLNGTTDGFLVSSNQDFDVEFVGNTGTGVIQEYDAVAAAWRTSVAITDALVHTIRWPGGAFRVGCVTATGTTAVKLRTSRQSGTP